MFVSTSFVEECLVRARIADVGFRVGAAIGLEAVFKEIPLRQD